jgi:hypothetical protein
MHRKRWHTGPVLLIALLLAVPRPALGQSVDMTVRARPGTRIPVDQLAAFVARTVMIGETEKNLSVAFRMESITRERGVVATVESGPVRMEPGRAYSASAWITQPDEFNSALAAPLKPAEFVIFRIFQKTDPRSPAIPPTCRTATSALRLTLVSGRSVASDGSLVLCFDQGS